MNKEYEDDLGHSWKPNLFVPGFPKCGTSALCDYLSQHKDIYVIEKKEPHSLTKGLPPSKFEMAHHNFRRTSWIHLPYDKYKRLYMQNKNKRYRVDGSQSLSGIDKSIDIPLYIKNFSPQAKIILMIREQTKRLISFYLFGRMFGIYNDEFDKWLERVSPYIDDFLFYDKIVRFYEVYNNDMIVISNNSLLTNPQHVMDNVFEFLGLEKIQVNILHSNETFIISNKIIDNLYWYTLHTGQKLAITLKDLPYGNIIIERIMSPLRRRITDSTRKTFGSKPHLIYQKLLAQIPSNINNLLIEDYEKSISFLRAKKRIIE